ncbi:MAG: hypothetical protein ACI9LX_001788 [Paraglaciecola sp.]|jgi:hypothetical protein
MAQYYLQLAKATYSEYFAMKIAGPHNKSSN